MLRHTGTCIPTESKRNGEGEKCPYFVTCVSVNSFLLSHNYFKDILCNHHSYNAEHFIFLHFTDGKGSFKSSTAKGLTKQTEGCRVK